MPHHINQDTKTQVDLLLETVFRRYGYDFRNYAVESIRRRLSKFLVDKSHNEIIDIIPRIYHDQAFFYELLFALPVSVTEMFRDPNFYKAFAEQVLPMLDSYPYLKIWHAGCASGEEVYSSGIMFYEHNKFDVTTFYGTDINIPALETARAGIYSQSSIEQYNKNYIHAGGQFDFNQYFFVDYGYAKIQNALKKQMVFSEHNLISDSVFNEMNVVFCRNVMIYFDDQFKKKAMKVICDSLIHNGILCLGEKESLLISEYKSCFEVIDRKHRIYKKVSSL